MTKRCLLSSSPPQTQTLESGRMAVIVKNNTEDIELLYGIRTETTIV
jgi:hypothetical protein